MTKRQQAIREFARVMIDVSSNLRPTQACQRAPRPAALE
jgi:hypothetical protein